MEDVRSKTAEGDFSGTFFNKALFWKTCWTNSSIDFQTVEAIVDLGEHFFKSFFCESNGSVKPSFFTHSKQYLEDCNKYVSAIVQGLRVYDQNGTSSVRPASRFLYYVEMQKRDNRLLIPIFCPALISAVIKSLSDCNSALHEVNIFASIFF